MASYQFTDQAGGSLSFDPSQDVLVFATAAAHPLGGSAAQLQFTISGSDLLVGLGGPTVRLLNLGLAQLAAGDLLFDDGSLFLPGTAGADTLNGGSGADYLGGAGADTMTGAGGNDRYIVDDVGDRINEGSGGGIDTVEASRSFGLSSNVEHLVLVGSALVGYGNNLANHLSGNAGDNLLDGRAGADTMVGGMGNDSYVISSSTDVVTELSGEGTDTVQSDGSHTLGANLEALVLTGSLSIYGVGNELDNSLTGNPGSNILTGMAGADLMKGGNGDDTYNVDNTADTAVENSGQGTDLVRSSVSFTLGNHVENLLLTGSAGVNGTGNSVDNNLTGNTGNNLLDGKAGADTMTGGGGNDTYQVDNVADVVTEAAGAGNDTVRSSISLTLGSNLENLTLIGSLAIDGSGNDLANALVGNSAANVLSGGAGADFLDGGAGVDTLGGGLGDDTYVIDGGADVLTEAVGEGIDTVLSAVTFTLGGTFENLTLTGNAAINGTGNALANVLTGNSAANVLTGGAGNDTYVVNGADDVTMELASAGTDLVLSSVSYTLAANLEQLTLTGTASINATGNGQFNVLIGNAGNNLLDGGGTAPGNASPGITYMTGGAGNDTYVADNNLDQFTEHAGGGIDLILDYFGVGMDAHVENLTVMGTEASTSFGNGLDNVMTGSNFDNSLVGGAGNDTLLGRGGSDNLRGGDGDDVLVAGGGNKDTVKGDAGADRFVFTAVTDTQWLDTQRDSISDFKTAEGDLIDVSAIDADTTLAGDQAFTFIGSAEFSAAGQLRISGNVLYGSVDGDTTGEFSIGLASVTSLNASDFLL
ncbi:MAG TPA: calcium-binding protein [Solimonas sp.]|nr:calcium-binding protein [Solimonas sp.]